MGQEAKKKFIINVVFFALSIGLIWLISKFLLGFLLPFVIGTVLAFAVQKPARLISEHFKLSVGTWAAILVVAVYVGGMALIGIALWQAVIQLSGFFSSLPEQVKNAAELFGGMGNYFDRLLDKLPQSVAGTVSDTLSGTLGNLVSNITAAFSKLITAAAGNTPAFLFSFIVTVVASCYIAKDFERLKKFVKSMMKIETACRLATLKNIFAESVLKLFCGYGILALVTFAELAVSFSVIRVKHAVVIAAVTALIDILPVFGSGTVLLPWAVICFLSGNFSRGAALCVIYLLITVVRYFIEPKIIGKQIGINPLLTLLAMFLGLKLGGVGGMLLFPVVCIVVVDYYRRQLEEEKTNIHKENTDA